MDLQPANPGSTPSGVHSSPAVTGSDSKDIQPKLLKSCHCGVSEPENQEVNNVQGSYSITDKKIQDFSRTFQDPMKNFPGPFRSLRMFKYKEKNGIYLQYSECSPLQKISIWSTRKMHDFQGYFSRTFHDLKL